jgi:polygalacturonase
MQYPLSRRAAAGLSRTLSAVSLLAALASCTNNDDITPITYLCGEETPVSYPQVPEGALPCGHVQDSSGNVIPDPDIGPEPYVDEGIGWPPPDPTDPACILRATRVTPPEGQVLDEPSGPIDTLDTKRINDAILYCRNAGSMVKLTKSEDGVNDAFLSGNIRLDSVILWIDQGVTLFMSRNSDLFQKTGNCGVIGINDSGACIEFITVIGTRPGIIGDGIIDGQGGEPLVGKDYSWWQMSYALREINGSIGNPTMINNINRTMGFVLYRITLNNSAKFHVKLHSFPPAGVDQGCPAPGTGFKVWGVTVMTPSKWFNSAGYQLTPSWARNTDGIDPGANNIAYCGVIACSTISTGDDQIAIKGGHWVEDLVIAHNNFGTGHGMSIGSETYGVFTSPNGTVHRGVQNVRVKDLTIDADSRLVGHEAHGADFNGIRVKSDTSRGGLVADISYTDVCLRDMVNAILVSTAYNPLFAGDYVPEFKALTFRNVRHSTCKALAQPIVTLEGFNVTMPAGPITLDNVILDSFGDHAAAAEFADIVLGPGDVSFMPSGMGVNVTNNIVPGSVPPRQCTFPKLRGTPQPPPGWKN